MHQSLDPAGKLKDHALTSLANKISPGSQGIIRSNWPDLDGFHSLSCALPFSRQQGPDCTLLICEHQYKQSSACQCNKQQLKIIAKKRSLQKTLFTMVSPSLAFKQQPLTWGLIVNVDLQILLSQLEHTQKKDLGLA
jgi:hypothetical protein